MTSATIRSTDAISRKGILWKSVDSGEGRNIHTTITHAYSRPRNGDSVPCFSWLWRRSTPERNGCRQCKGRTCYLVARVQRNSRWRVIASRHIPQSSRELASSYTRSVARRPHRSQTLWPGCPNVDSVQDDVICIHPSSNIPTVFSRSASANLCRGPIRRYAPSLYHRIESSMTRMKLEPPRPHCRGSVRFSLTNPTHLLEKRALSPPTNTRGTAIFAHAR